MSRADELRRLGLAWNDAWNSRDSSRLTRFFAPASSFYEPGLLSPMNGVEGVMASATKTWSEWPGAVFEPVSITVQDSRVVVEWRTSATHKTGLAHVLEGADILEFDGDLIVSCRTYCEPRTRKPTRSNLR